MEGTQQSIAPPLCLLAPADSPRLRYVAGWIEEVWRIQILLLFKPEEVPEAMPVLAYGVFKESALLSIPDEGLLFATGASGDFSASALQMCHAWAGLHPADNQPPLPEQLAAFFEQHDLLSHLFFHLSRYEEYAAVLPDRHGRYRASGSVLYRSGLLQRPVLDEWLHALKALLAKAIAFPTQHFSYQPTYDIDAAWAYQHKGFLRNAGAFIKDITALKWKQASARIVAGFGHHDPHDAYAWLQRLHQMQPVSPHYFVLAAVTRTPFDKNIHPKHPAMVQLIQQLSAEAPVWMHPSYFSTEPAVFEQEQKALEAATGKAISQSRQHFIRFALPGGYRYLTERGITGDWSMGYGTHLGFRAGTGRSFLWYDLEREEATTLRVHPFCFMDSTAHYHEQLSCNAAFSALHSMAEALQKTESTLVTVFHNFSLGTAPEWEGWRNAYAGFLAEMNERSLK